MEIRRLQSQELIRRFLPGVKEFKREIKGRDALLDNTRAKALLGWKQQRFLNIE